MPADDIYELTVRSTLAGQNLANVHHFKQVGSDGTGTAEEALDTIWQAVFKPLFLQVTTSTFEVVDLSIRQIQPVQTQPTVFGALAMGDEAGEALPSHCCVLLRQQAIPSGRKGSGSMKVPAVPLTFVDRGRITLVAAVLYKALGDAYEAQHTDVASGYTFDPVVYSQIDSVGRKIMKSTPSTRTRTVHSRQIGVGD